MLRGAAAPEASARPSATDPGARGAESVGTSFQLSFHLAPLGVTGPHSLDKVPELSCKDSTRQYAVDDLRLSCKQQERVASLGGADQVGELHNI